MKSLKGLITVGEAAEIMKCTRRWVAVCVKNGVLTNWRYATIAERKYLKGNSFHSRLLLLSADEVLEYMNK